jgi:hypothetical protein
MPNITTTLTPTAVNSINAKWCVKGYSGWCLSGQAFAVGAGTYTIQFGYVEGYSTPADQTISVGGSDVAPSGVYGAVSWPAAWNPPISMCLFKGQVFAAGSKLTVPGAAARRVRWSEIGAFRFFGATANPLRNEAGEYYMEGSDTEMVMRVIATEDAVFAFGHFSVVAFIPVTQPAPAFQIKRIMNTTGIMNPLAVAYGNGKLVYVDREGYLRTITGDSKTGFTSKNIGYEDLFSAMQASMSMATGVGVISIVYNPDEDEFYIGTATKSYLFDGTSLTEMERSYTSYVNLKNSILAAHDGSVFRTTPLGAVTAINATPVLYFITETIDFNVSSIKTINSIEVVGKFGTSAVVQVMVQWRNSRSGAFNSTSWKRCSPTGTVSPIVSGVDFRIAVQVDVYDGTVIDSLVIEWQLSDKNTVRGNYTDVNSASPNASR